MGIILSDISYHYNNQLSLFESVNLSVVSGKKVSVIGNNGTGKSTLLKLIAGKLDPSSGSIHSSSLPYYVPQQIGITGKSVSRALGVADKIGALQAICNGSDKAAHYETLADDWDIESRCLSAFDHWGLSHIDLAISADILSGGEKTKLFLSGLMVHRPAIILLDEPTNHLDAESRNKLYDYLRNSKSTVMVVSHDITLLNLLDATYELSSNGLKLYGGNYDFYREQKDLEDCALEQQINAEQTALRLTRKKAREVRERQEKRIKRSEKHTSGIPRIMLGSLQNKGENSTAKLNEKHSDIIIAGQEKLLELKQKQQISAELKINVENTRLHNNKLLVSTIDLNFGYTKDKQLWQVALNMEIRSGERIHIKGGNGTGKTTLIKLLAGTLQPTTGKISKADFSSVYLDQEYSEVNTPETVLELTGKYNLSNLPDHEIKLRLHRALFPKDTWDKKCNTLSGGERMRLYLCCLMISNNIPDLFILDEPTNNLDLSSLAILTQTIRNYRGTLLVISHDQHFVNEINITRIIKLI